MRLVEGTFYEVVKDGARLHRWFPTAPYCHQMEGFSLRKGTIVEYVGSPMGIGSDNVPEDTFRVDGEGFVGAFSPNFWGSADKDYLKPVS